MLSPDRSIIANEGMINQIGAYSMLGTPQCTGLLHCVVYACVILLKSPKCLTYMSRVYFANARRI